MVVQGTDGVGVDRGALLEKLGDHRVGVEMGLGFGLPLAALTEATMAEATRGMPMPPGMKIPGFS